jgi:chemotaxis signal transduction protein
VSEATRGPGVSADELRRAFDLGFATPPADGGESEEPFLALTMGKDAYAVRVREIAGFAAARKIVALASPIPEMLGLAGLRGTLMAVYSLARLFGYEDSNSRLRWFIVCGGADPLALAFADFDGYIEVPRSELRAASERDPGRLHTREVLLAGGVARGVIGVTSLVRAIEKKVAAAGGANQPSPALLGRVDT